MKKKSLFLLLSIVLMGGMVFTSCNDDDDDKGKSSPVIGAWKMTDIVGHIQKYYYFGKNGYAAEINVSYDIKMNYKGYYLNVREYSTSGNKLLFDDNSATYSLTDKTLTLSFGVDEMVFKAVDYNEVKEYIDGVPKLLTGVWAHNDVDIKPDGTRSESYMILNDDSSADELEVYFDEYGNYQKSYVSHGKWSFSDLIFRLDTKGSSNKCLVSVENVTGYTLSYHYYDKNHNNKEFDFHRWDMNDIKHYLDNATKK